MESRRLGVESYYGTVAFGVHITAGRRNSPRRREPAGISRSRGGIPCVSPSASRSNLMKNLPARPGFPSAARASEQEAGLRGQVSERAERRRNRHRRAVARSDGLMGTTAPAGGHASQPLCLDHRGGAGGGLGLGWLAGRQPWLARCRGPVAVGKGSPPDRMLTGRCGGWDVGAVPGGHSTCRPRAASSIGPSHPIAHSRPCRSLGSGHHGGPHVLRSTVHGRPRTSLAKPQELLP